MGTIEVFLVTKYMKYNRIRLDNWERMNYPAILVSLLYVAAPGPTFMKLTEPDTRH